MDLHVRTLSEMEKDDLQNTQSNDKSHKKLPTKYGQIRHVKFASDKKLASTSSSKGIDYIYFFTNQELEILTRAMNAIAPPKRTFSQYNQPFQAMIPWSGPTPNTMVLLPMINHPVLEIVLQCPIVV